MIGGIVTAAQTLTIVPVPGSGSRKLWHSLPFFPLVGALLGFCTLPFFYGQQLLADSRLLAVAVFAALTCETWLTGALHVDGLADVFDAFGGGRSRERIHEILKDSHLGTFGTCAIVFVIGLKASLWWTLWSMAQPLMVVWSIVLARCAQSLLLAYCPPARSNSIVVAFGGTGARVAAAATALLVAAFAVWQLGVLSGLMLSGSTLIAALISAAVFMRVLGGVTGDCIGAASEVTEVSVLIAAAILAS